MGEYGDTALIYAVYKGFEPIVRALIEKGANINHTNSIGNSPLITSVVGKNFILNIHILTIGLKNMCIYHLKASNENLKSKLQLLCHRNREYDESAD